MKSVFYLFLTIPLLFSCSSDDDGFSVPENGVHDFVDLGLSVYWATCNVGAETPAEYGDYFAWGETSPKQNYTMVTYTYEGDLDNISGTRYDAARVNWGGGWRMPTKEEMEELVSKCEWSRGTITGPNGNTIYLPKAGMISGTTKDDVGSHFYYWTSNKKLMLADDEVGNMFYYGKLDCESHLGFPIRPVRNK